MDALLLISRGYVVVMAAVGFLFGQIFFATFTFGGTLAGVFGVIAGLLGCIKGNALRNRLVIFACTAATVGVGLDAYHYYKYLDIPGNYYAWVLIGPFVACLALIAMACAWLQVKNG